MENFVKLIIAFFLLALISACGQISTVDSTNSSISVADNTAPAERWTGLVAVQESAKVWQLYDASAPNLTLFAQRLEAGLKDGTVKPATGRFDFIPYAGGRPADVPHTVLLRTQDNGTWYFRGPSAFFAPGRALCVKGPWSVIATQRRFPSAAGPDTNCIDFGPEASNPGFANSNYNAATIVMVQPAG